MTDNQQNKPPVRLAVLLSISGSVARPRGTCAGLHRQARAISRCRPSTRDLANRTRNIRSACRWRNVYDWILPDSQNCLFELQRPPKGSEVGRHSIYCLDSYWPFFRWALRSLVLALVAWKPDSVDTSNVFKWDAWSTVSERSGRRNQQRNYLSVAN